MRRPKAPFQFWEYRFSLHSVAPPPHQAQQEESRGEQRKLAGSGTGSALALEMTPIGSEARFTG